jgi:glycerophosphoryl diester phosphodiesterase
MLPIRAVGGGAAGSPAGVGGKAGLLSVKTSCRSSTSCSSTPHGARLQPAERDNISPAFAADARSPRSVSRPFHQGFISLTSTPPSVGDLQAVFSWLRSNTMRVSSNPFLLLMLLVAALAIAAQSNTTLAASRDAPKLVIAHRGASGYLPEHTLPAYALAYGLGADYIEQDVVMTRDGVLIALHDVTLQNTTNVEELFPARAREHSEWFAADFTLDEIKQLSAEERLEGRFRQDSQGFEIPTLEEVVQMIQELNRLTGCEVGIYPEMKEPAFHRDEGLPIEAALLELLTEYGYEGADANVFVQSFEPDSLKFMRSTLGTTLPLVQLIGTEAVFTPLITAAGLDDIATYADGIGPSKSLIEDENGRPINGNELVQLAHARGLVVHPYTFRADQVPAVYDDLQQELRRFYFRYGADGVFTDHPDVAVRLLQQGLSTRELVETIAKQRFCE